MKSETGREVIEQKEWVRRLGWLGVGLMIVTLVLIVLSLWLTLRNGYEIWSQSFLVSVAIASLVAGLITSRRPQNPVGWFITAFALCFALGEFSRQYVIYGAFRNPGVLPALSLMAIPVYTVWFAGLIFVMVLMPLYFPNGRLVSRDWRPVVWLAVVLIIAVTGLAALRPRADEIPGYPNPLGIGILIAPPEIIQTVFNGLQASWVILSFVATSSLVVRYRHAGAQERQQLKWFMSALGTMLVFVILDQVLRPSLIPEGLSSIVFALVLAGIWIAIAIAILRYRLFDIDILIRRTVTYAVVAALLAVIYFGCVIVLQQVFAVVSGQRSEVITVLSTLAIAALFVPLRNRIQGEIDRRFNRKKYDTQQVLQDFAMTVRDETDLEKLSARLIEVVNETMQPTTVSVWLNDGRQQTAGSRQRLK